MPANKKKKKRLSGKKAASAKAGTNHKKKSNSGKSVDLAVVFHKARLLYAQNRFSETIEILEKLPSEIVLADKDTALEYYRLMAFSLTNEDEFNKAHDITIKALKLEQNDRDFYFVQSFIATSFKDYKRTIQCGLKFLELLKNDKSRNSVKYLSKGQLHLLYNYLGLAHKAQKDYDKAIEYLNMANAENLKYMHPYLNLGNLYLQQKEYNKAEKLLTKG